MLTVKSDERTGDYQFASAELSTVFSLGPGPYLLHLMLNARPVYLNITTITFSTTYFIIPST